MKTIYHKILFILAVALATGCEDFLEQVPEDSVTELNAINDLESAEAALAALYNTFSGFTSEQNFDLIISMSNMADEQSSIIGTDIFSLNLITPVSTSHPWINCWNAIKGANNMIDLTSPLTTIPTEAKEEIIAEAKWIRAFNYLQLIQFFGDIPYSESADYRDLQVLSRIPKEEVYAILINEVEAIKTVLPIERESEDLTRTRITQGTAAALLARLYLYTEDWAKAETLASEVIGNTLYNLQSDYEMVFTKNSGESILELYSDGAGNIHLGPAQLYFPESMGGLYITVPINKLVNSFEPGDVRFATAVAFDEGALPYINKYRDVARTGDFQELKIFRLAEQYLIRAEARVQEDNLAGAIDDINTIRNRAGLANTAAIDKGDLLLAIEQERYIELCFEGFRFFDLVRTDRADAVLGALKPSWTSKAKLLPIPQSELDLNPNLLPQNEGY